MSDIERYRFEDEEGREDGFATFSAQEAREYAERNGLLWIADTFVWEEDGIVDDFRPRHSRAGTADEECVEEFRGPMPPGWLVSDQPDPWWYLCPGHAATADPEHSWRWADGRKASV